MDPYIPFALIVIVLVASIGVPIAAFSTGIDMLKHGDEADPLRKEIEERKRGAQVRLRNQLATPKRKPALHRRHAPGGPRAREEHSRAI